MILSDNIKKFIKATEFLREELGDIPLQTLAVLLIVAEEGVIPHSLIQKKAGIAQASVSRNLMLLSRVDRRGREGLDLVVSFTDPHEHRRKLAQLNKNGEELLKKLEDFLE